MRIQEAENIKNKYIKIIAYKSKTRRQYDTLRKLRNVCE